MYDTDEGEGESGGKNEEMLVTKRKLGKAALEKQRQKRKAGLRRERGRTIHPIPSRLLKKKPSQTRYTMSANPWLPTGNGLH